MNHSNSINHATTNPAAAAAAAANASFVPCVPIAVSSSLVSTQTLAKRLAAITPELAHLSLQNFQNIQHKKSELRLKINECAASDEALLNVFKLNVANLFARLASYQIRLGHAIESNFDGESKSTVQFELQQVDGYAAAMGLLPADYCVDGNIQPEMLFDGCLKRLQLFQKRWQDNCFQATELGLQLQRDAIYGAVANCLTQISEHGLENQLSLEPTPQAQEDVLVALAKCIDLPFSGAWPELRNRLVVANHQSNAGSSN